MMRGVIIFLLAVGLGALTVSGQDGNAQNDLRRRIRALTEELRRRADTTKPARNETGRPVMRIYDIGDLLMRLPYETGEIVDLIPSKFSPPAEEEIEEPASPFEIDWMIEMIRQLIEPQTWDTIEYADMQPKAGRLFVNNIPRVHRKIDAFLGSLRAIADRQLRVEVYAVPVDGKDAALLAKRTRELTGAEADRLLARPSMGTAEIVCRSDQNLVQRIGRKVSYLGDYDVEIAQEATIGDPIRRSAFSGMSVELLALLDDGAKGARLDIQLNRTQVREPMRRVDTEHGPLELPELALTRVRSTMWVPLGQFVILGGATAGDKPCLFVGRVTRVGGKKR